jgi:trehalose-6-phosphate hydrolase
MTKLNYNNLLIYQLYLPSFGKSFNEIIDMTKYFVNLNIKYIWLSPIFPHGNKDGGYDITDFYDTNKEYGTIDDLKKLIKIYHQNNIKIIIDIIPNHTSIHHKWFQESKNIDSKKRDWYVWIKKEQLPNNWYSYFEKSPWTYDKLSNSYYYHHFYKEQPDLNFWNKDVQNEIKKIFYYWLDLGIDGFRIDAIGCLFHDNKFRNNKDVPINNKKIPRDIPRKRQLNHEKTFDFLNELKNNIKNKYPNTILLGETEFHTLNDKISLTKNLDLSMNYNWAYINELDHMKFHKEVLIWNNLCESLKKDPLYFLYNHDESRGRYGENKNINIRKLLFILLHSMPGYKIMYYGEELGMSDGENNNIDIFGRDKYRSPYPWNSNFKIKNWISQHPDHKMINLKKQKQDENSYYNWVIKIINLFYENNKCKFNIKKFSNLLIINKNDLEIILNFKNDFCIKVDNKKILDSNLYENIILKKYGYIIKKI